METDVHADVLRRFEAVGGTDAYHVADAAVGGIIERSGRGDARDALGGPLMAMMRLPEPSDVPDAVESPSVSPAASDNDGDAALSALDPVAEPALGALLALLVRDLLTAAQFNVLYEPFATAIPTASLS